MSANHQGGSMFKKRLLLIIAGVAFLLLQNVAMGIPLPEKRELIYDDGDAECGVAPAYMGNIFAVRFTPPEGKWKIKTAVYYLYIAGSPFEVRIFDDHSGYPGDDLLEYLEIAPEHNKWYYVDLEPYDIWVRGDFYTGFESLDTTIATTFLGADWPNNGRSWEYTRSNGWWTNFEDSYTYFIRAIITNDAGIEEELIPKPSFGFICNPNPFSASTAISYALPQASRVTVSIWDASGRCVRILIDANQAGGNHSVEWDGADNAGCLLPAGVYFSRIETDHSTLTQKVVLVR
ncbi:hypothetical protein CEE36_01360 [candidate division TA06 bacterium B3_TA06]|uniref:FlgD/Vpr Ig-like domain-containing protein n=1 Tax=candidate division TA06 bacterium B3_TA06 TaxID=2012487 RepID=A0A532VBR5_UNCT6|nr:MAG: hypothetical protein CEE36_01360 [candidate division TA06 bacterium B3_TA06]